MEMDCLVDVACVFPDVVATDKSQLLKDLVQRLAKRVDVNAQDILRALTAREALGSTGMGQGIAIPHAQIPGLKRFVGCFARLSRPVDFAAIDAKPVDLVFMLLIPEGCASEHVGALACISRRLRDQNLVARLRSAFGPEALHALLIASAPAVAAVTRPAEVAQLYY